MVFFNSIILVLLDVYIFRALRSTNTKLYKRKIFSWLWWGYSLILIFGVFMGIYFDIPLSVRSIILVVFFLTFIVKFIFAVFLGFDDLRRSIIWFVRKFFNKKEGGPNSVTTPSNPIKPSADPVLDPVPVPVSNSNNISRSSFLMKAGILVGSAPLFPLSWGILSGAYDYRIRRQTLYLPNLPSSFDGMTIAQLSDVHSGSFYNKKAVLGGVEMLLAEKPDMVFFTGDLVNNLSNEMRDYQDIFAKVKAPLGVFSTLGNHDYGHYHFGPEDSPAKAKNLLDLIETHKIMGWDLLNNENRKIKLGGDEIAIVGVENWGAGRFPKYGKIEKALANTEDSSVKLLLSHDPSHWRAQILNQTDVDVTFSGHTHGMQFGVRAEHFKWSPVQYLYKEWAGLYKQGNQQLYVNTGFGFLGYPGRVGILPEITIFELKKGSKA